MGRKGGGGGEPVLQEDPFFVVAGASVLALVNGESHYFKS